MRSDVFNHDFRVLFFLLIFLLATFIFRHDHKVPIQVGNVRHILHLHAHVMPVGLRFSGQAELNRALLLVLNNDNAVGLEVSKNGLMLPDEAEVVARGRNGFVTRIQVTLLDYGAVFLEG